MTEQTEPIEPTESTEPIEPTNAELLQRVKTDPKFFIEKALVIIDKETNTHIRFKFNRIQNYYWDNHSKFDYIIKSRKGGISTLNIGRFVHKCNFFKNQRAIMLCQNDDATNKMFHERLKPILENSRWPMKYKIYKSDGLVEFQDTGSTFYIGTAGSKTFGRGSDITLFHLSEFCHWENNIVLTSVEEALMDEAEGVIETTANGINFGHHLWKKSKDSESRYKPIFIPWFYDDSYRIKGIQGFNDITDQEKELVDVFGIDSEQIAWRRKKRRDMSKPELFPQEYPATEDEAFISSGSMVFDWIALIDHEKFCREPLSKGYLVDAGEEIQFKPLDKGNLNVWQRPETAHSYIIGADIAEGVPNGCFSAAFIIDINTMEQAAEYHGHLTPSDFGDVLDVLGRWYNCALMAPEGWPGCGSVTLQRLIDLNYPRIWKREKSDYSHKKDNQLLGWETTKRTKPLMIHSLADAIKNYLFKIRSKYLINELRSFVYDGDEMSPQEGCFSDRVIACAICWFLAEKYTVDLDPGNKTFRELYVRGRSSGFMREPNFTPGGKYGVRPN